MVLGKEDHLLLPPHSLSPGLPNRGGEQRQGWAVTTSGVGQEEVWALGCAWTDSGP